MPQRYVTVSVCKKNIEDARAYFARAGAELTARFAALGAKATEMDTTEKLRVLHDFYRSGEEVYFHFDARDMMRKGHDFRDYICPDSIEKHSDYLMLGGKYARVIYLKDYASFISDQLVTKLTDQSRNMMLSIDIIPVATDEAVREVERKMLGVETNITNWQRRQNANNNFSAIVPYDMEQQRRETKEYMTDLTSRDQRMMLSVLTIVHLADTKAELDADTDALLKVAADHMCQMAVLRYQQLDGLNTALPIGTRKIDTFRTLTTESLAVFMPFKVQEIQEPGGIYFGENAISHNLILCNMKNLLNQSMMLLGIPGSGKSFFAKLLIVAIALSTNENVYFLNTVTTDDLLPLAEQGKEPPKEVTPEPEPKPTEPVEEVPEPEPEKKDSPLLSLLLIGAVVLAGGGIGYYFKIYKPKHEAPDLEDDYCEYEDGELEEIAEEPEDEDTPPWEEDTEE